MRAPDEPWLWPWLGLLAVYGLALVGVLWPVRRPPSAGSLIPQQRTRQEARR